MKKHLIAAAVAGALAVPAMAQVTISGYLEAGFIDQSIEGADPADRSQVAGGIFGSPRVVFSGSEDLGGGLKAGFRLESSVDVTTGRFGAGNTTGDGYTDGSGYFDRGAEINLSGAFGMIRLGKFDHLGAEDNDLNVIGNVALFTGASNSAFGAVTSEAGSVEFGSDRDGTIAYRSPTLGAIGGFVEIAVTPEDQGANLVPGGSAASTDDNGIRSIAARGTIGGVNYRLGWGELKLEDDTKDKVMGLGLSYNFGPVSASIAYQTYNAAEDDSDRKETVVAVNVPLGQGFAVRGLYKDYSHDESANDVQTMGIGVSKALSKRSTLFAFYRDVNRDTTDDSQLYLGVSHSF